MKLIAPSILSADFSKLGREVQAVEQAGADWIHIDVMDGHFVPNITMGPLVVEAVRKATALPLDVHLMIEQPERFIDDFARAGATLISVHVETGAHLNRTIQMIRQHDIQAGVVLNPATPICSLEWILSDVDLILLMGVNPGFGGQTFIPGTLKKIADLKNRLENRKLSTLIQVDGGVNLHTIRNISMAGTDVFVAGSAIFESRNYRETIDQFRKAIIG